MDRESQLYQGFRHFAPPGFSAGLRKSFGDQIALGSHSTLTGRRRVGGRPQLPHMTWSAEQLRRFLAADADRLAPLWRLMTYGLRRSEGAGLLWANVRIADRTATRGRSGS